MKGGAAAVITVIALVMLAFIIAFPRVAAGVYTVSILIAFLGVLIEGLKNE